MPVDPVIRWYGLYRLMLDVTFSGMNLQVCVIGRVGISPCRINSKIDWFAVLWGIFRWSGAQGGCSWLTLQLDRACWSHGQLGSAIGQQLGL